ncbi:MAG: hypothetical protein VKQ33_13700 [Candidatus Sericytochromatia bacterium]|nr:hypothetical protein [Candidatus Sericytochromatia bacterium]
MRRLPGRPAGGASPGLLAFLGALAPYAVAVARGPWASGAGFHLQQAALVAAGHWQALGGGPHPPPLMAVVNAAPVWLGLDRYALVVGLPVFWTAAVGLATVACARRLVPGAPPLLAWLLGAGYALFAVEFGGNLVTPEHAVVLWGLLAVAGFGPPERARPGNFAAAGLACGLAGIWKPIALVLVLPFALQVRRPWQGLALAAGGLAPFGVLVAWLGGDWRALVSGATWLTGWTGHPAWEAWWRSLWRLKAEVLSLPVSVPAEFRRATLGVLAGLATGLAGLWVLGRWREDGAHRQGGWVAGWLGAGALLLATRFVQDGPHHTLNCWVSLVVVWLGYLERYGPRHTLRAWGLTLAAGWGVVALHAPWNPGYLQRLGQAGPLDAFFVPVAREVNRLVPARASVVDAQPEPILLFLAGRVPANGKPTEGPISVTLVNGWVPPGRPCYVLASPVGAPTSTLVLQLASDPRYELVAHWQAQGRHLQLYRRR